MKEFLIGLLVIFSVLLLAGLGILLFPLLLVLGLALRLLVVIFVGLFAIWLVGKLALILIDAVRGKEQSKKADPE
jgi:hypothetical protein